MLMNQTLRQLWQDVTFGHDKGERTTMDSFLKCIESLVGCRLDTLTAAPGTNILSCSKTPPD